MNYKKACITKVYYTFMMGNFYFLHYIHILLNIILKIMELCILVIYLCHCLTYTGYIDNRGGDIEGG